jgi:hypothetical protein
MADIMAFAISKLCSPYTAYLKCQLRSLNAGVTRRPRRLLEHDNLRVGGRVHAVIGRRAADIQDRLALHLNDFTLSPAETR